jgi:hypothetical protein
MRATIPTQKNTGRTKKKSETNLEIEMSYRPIASIALCAIIAIGIQTPKRKAISANSTEGKVSSNNSVDADIQRLTLEKNKRREAADSWDRWNIRFLFLAGLAATFLVVTAVGVSRSNRALINSSDELDKANAAKLAVDLASKDTEIANTKTLVGAANEKAGIANQLAGEANERAGNANQRAEVLAKENLATEVKLEKEKRARLELEKSLAPRVLTIASYIDDRATYASLRPFPDTKVLMYVLSDAEAQRAAGSIAALIQQAFWKIETVTITSDLNSGFYDGVVVSPPMRILPEYPLEDKQNAARSGAAADALVAILKSQNWEARAQPAEKAFEQDTKTLKIFVGFKPSPYFDPDWVKKLRSDSEKLDRP